MDLMPASAGDGSTASQLALLRNGFTARYRGLRVNSRPKRQVDDLFLKWYPQESIINEVSRCLAGKHACFRE